MYPCTEFKFLLNVNFDDKMDIYNIQIIIKEVFKMYLTKRILAVVFIVLTINVSYSQQKKNSYYSFDSADFVLKNFSKDFLCDTTLYIYMDSSIINGLTVHTDSIRVDVSNNDDCIIVFGSSNFHTMSQNNGGLLYKIHYPIPLIDNPLFKKAVYHNDESWLTTSNVTHVLYHQEKEKKNGFFVFSSDGKYINYGFLEEKDGDVYTKYNPLNENNSSTVMTIKRKKLRDWLSQEMNKKDEVFSIAKKGDVYVVKSFKN